MNGLDKVPSIIPPWTALQIMLFQNFLLLYQETKFFFSNLLSTQFNWLCKFTFLVFQAWTRFTFFVLIRNKMLKLLDQHLTNYATKIKNKMLKLLDQHVTNYVGWKFWLEITLRFLSQMEAQTIYQIFTT